MTRPAAPSTSPGINFSNFDDTWFERAFRDFSSSASNVITVATSDPDREEQTQFFLQAAYKDRLYRFDPWNGLQQWKPAARPPRFEPVVEAPDLQTAAYNPGLTNDLLDLSRALRFSDSKLRGGKAALLIQGLDGVRDQNQGAELAHAIREWALAQPLFAHKSLVCLLCADPATVLDSFTLDRTILTQPALASDSERLAMTSAFASGLARPITDETRLHGIATGARGLNLHQVRVVLQKTAHRDQELPVELIKHYKSDYIRRSDVLDIEEPEFGFENVGGYEPIKEMVRNTLIRALHEPERARRAAIPLPRGLLIFGPPGTGKTLFAKAMAKETNLPFINLRTENLFGSLLGETGQRFRDAIRLAEQASPAIVFVDEIDRFGKRSGTGSDGASQETHRVFAQILEWLGDQNRRSIVVGTTNEPEQLDGAFIRPGRFSYCIPFPYPNRTAREMILKIHLGLSGNRPKPQMREEEILRMIPRVAEGTRSCSGAELEEIVIRAKRRFFESNEDFLTGEHLRAAAGDLHIDANQRQGELERYARIGRQFSNSDDLIRRLAEDE